MTHIKHTHLYMTATQKSTRTKERTWKQLTKSPLASIIPSNHFIIHMLKSETDINPSTKEKNECSNSKTMADLDQDMNIPSSPDLSFASTLQITVAVIVLNFILFLIIIILYVRKKLLNQRASSRSRRLIFAPYDSSTPRHSLDTSILNSLPITVFQSKDEVIECAVCISELKEGEEVRFLPNCKHGFHVECIDMWFHSNDTCPLCRDYVTQFESSNSEVEVKEEGSSSSNAALRKRKEGVLMIDIPKPSSSFGFPSSRNMSLASSKMPSESPLPSSRLLEEMKTPGSGRMKSFKRLMGRVSFKGVASSSSSHFDIERGNE